MKYIVTALSTTLIMSLMMNIATYEDLCVTKKSEKISQQIIQTLANNVLSLQLQIDEK